MAKTRFGINRMLDRDDRLTETTTSLIRRAHDPKIFGWTPCAYMWSNLEEGTQTAQAESDTSRCREIGCTPTKAARGLNLPLRNACRRMWHIATPGFAVKAETAMVESAAPQHTISPRLISETCARLSLYPIIWAVQYRKT